MVNSKHYLRIICDVNVIVAFLALSSNKCYSMAIEIFNHTKDRWSIVCHNHGQCIIKDRIEVKGKNGEDYKFSLAPSKQARLLMAVKNNRKDGEASADGNFLEIARTKWGRTVEKDLLQALLIEDEKTGSSRTEIVDPCNQELEKHLTRKYTLFYRMNSRHDTHELHICREGYKINPLKD